MAKTIFEEMGETYTQVGDYLLPNITVPAEEKKEPIGLWGSDTQGILRDIARFCI